MAVSFQFIQTHLTTAPDQRQSSDCSDRAITTTNLTLLTRIWPHWHRPVFEMTQNSDTRPNFIAWYRDVFGFSDRVATALYDNQLFKDTSTIAEFGDSEIGNVCRTLRRDSSLPIAELGPSGSGTKFAPDANLVGPRILSQGPNLRPSICSMSRRDSKTVGLTIRRSPNIPPLPSTSPQPLRLLKRWRPSWPAFGACWEYPSSM